ncbi:SpoIIE family protein phosphatase [Streptomyces sp. NPDC090088]|uniref:SpoIIE family protein phosphatase n=1 Tax=Streptomyces sp. NPDC090088 TaxID=3365944 RepID=UPI0037FA062D
MGIGGEEWLAVDLSRRQTSIDVVDTASALLDEQGTVVGWTLEAERLLGYPAADVIGRAAASLLAPEDARRLTVLAERCREEDGWVGTVAVRHRDGRAVTVGTRIVPTTADQGRKGWLMLADDASGALNWAMDRAVLECMVTQSDVSMAVLDTDLRFLWSNPALERLGGVSLDERLGRRLGEVQPGAKAKAIEEQMRLVLDTGESVTDFEQLSRPRSSPDRDRAYRMSFTRLEDAAGRPVGVLYTVVDITDRYRARQRLALLERASSYIGRTLDVSQTAQDLADVAVPELADFVTVDLVQGVVDGWEPAPGLLSETDDLTLSRTGMQSIHQGVPEAATETGALVTYHTWSPPIRSLISGTPQLLSRMNPKDRKGWARVDVTGTHVAVTHSSMVVPIRARGITLGTSHFFRHATTEPFSDDDLKLAEEFVARAAVCIDNARRFTRERNAALALQRALLPRALPEQNAVDVAFRYLPAQADIGGDWFDAIPLSGARVALVVGDVVGHGLHASATMGRLRTAVRNFSDLDLPVDEVLTHLDGLVARLNDQTEEAGETEMVGGSCLYAVYDPTTRNCTLARAGHPPPALVLPDGTVTFPDLPAGLPLGLGGQPVETVDLELPEGSQLILYTDGLIEDRHRDIGTGLERMRKVLAEPHDHPEQTCQALMGALQPARPLDDIALLVARTRTLDAEHIARWDLSPDPAAVSDLRAAVTQQLTHWNLDHLAFATELIVSELVTNALRYATPPIHLRLIRDRALICEIFDCSSTAPHLRRAASTDEGGRGLFLVAQLAHRWGTRYTASGKIIWAEQSFVPQGAQTLASASGP